MDGNSIVQCTWAGEVLGVGDLLGHSGSISY